jgi:hypothetical protein
MANGGITGIFSEQKSGETHEDAAVDQTMGDSRRPAAKVMRGPDFKKIGGPEDGRQPSQGGAGGQKPESPCPADPRGQACRKQVQHPVRRPERDREMKQHRVDRVAEEAHSVLSAGRHDQDENDGDDRGNRVDDDEGGGTGLFPQVVCKQNHATQCGHNQEDDRSRQELVRILDGVEDQKDKTDGADRAVGQGYPLGRLLLLEDLEGECEADESGEGK